MVILFLLLLIVTTPAASPSFSHFNSFLKKLLQIGRIHNSIVCSVGTVKCQLQNLFFFFSTFHGCHGGSKQEKKYVNLF